jgi:hypothetical protein
MDGMAGLFKERVVAKRWWEMSPAERDAQTPEGRLRVKLMELLRCEEADANEVVSLIGEIVDDKATDLENKINRTGDWSPDF